MNLGQVLKDHFSVKDEDLNKALELQKELGGDIGQILVQTGTITENQLIEALSRQLNIPLFNGGGGGDEGLTAFLDGKVDYDFLIKNNFVPLKVDHESKILYAVTNDPLNYSVSDYVVKATRYNIQLSLAPESTVKELSRSYSPGQPGSDFVSLAIEEDTEKLKEMAFEAPVIKYLNGLLSKAVELRASDIHIESSEKTHRVRFRIDGLLHDMGVLEETFYMATVSRIKLLAGLDIAEKRLPQDGKFSTKIASAFIDIRVSSIPTSGGEGVAMRLLYRERLTFDIQQLGIEEDHLETVIKLIAYPYGILLVTGPTGSGKSTTLYSVLTRLNSNDRKIITIEDPVEYQLEGINQIQVKSEIGLTFANALRSILRHDPDVIMVGEIRDSETAEISIQSALTGHLVLSTLHTNDAATGPFRLGEMGVEHYLINAAVIGVIAQRIIRKNCPFCSRDDHPGEDVLKEYHIPELSERYSSLLKGNPTFKRGEGCPKCAGTGYRGRLAIFELFEYTDELKEVFLKKQSLESLRATLRGGKNFRTLREDGMVKVAKGITTVEEVLRVC
jgi:type II secretory ATPase GspE/PulE/Tfp pilus assembly ATPase PilB-like protein